MVNERVSRVRCCCIHPLTESPVRFLTKKTPCGVEPRETKVT